MTESPVIFAKALDGEGGAIRYTDLNDPPSAKAGYWLHFDANHPDSIAAVQAAAPDIDESTLLAIFDSEARPRTLVLETGILIILRGINHNEGDEPEDMIAVRMWITNDRIISLRYRRSKTLMQIAKSLDKNQGPKTIGDIFSTMTTTLFSFIERSIDKLDEKIDLLESQVVDNPGRQLRLDISEVRKSAILLKRYLAPQKEAINQLRFAEAQWLSVKNARRIQEAQDILLRVLEDLDSIRERAQVVKDELVNSLSDRLNRNLYVLSVITAIFLPLGFLTGLFGINIGGMPGVDNGMAFSVFVIGLSVVVVIQIILFKLFKWF